MWGERSKQEYLWFMVTSGILFVLIIIGEEFPIVDTFMTWLIISIIFIGFVLWICRRLREESEMNFFLNATPEELLEYEKTHPLKETSLTREYPPDDNWFKS